MTDEEIICAFMEPEPGPSDARWHNSSIWYDEAEQHHYTYRPAPLTLDALWEVEERLHSNAELAHVYSGVLHDSIDIGRTWVWHATAEQKIAALAAVLRPIVEPK